MFCEECGAEVEEEDSFCRRCGHSVGGEKEAARSRVCSREREGRMVAGVCAGCANYFSKDVTIVRVVWVLSSLIPPFFPGVAAYMVSWLLMPAPPDGPRGQRSQEPLAVSK